MESSCDPRQLGFVGIQRPTARRTDPDTSREAGQSIRFDAGTLTTAQLELLDVIAAAGGDGLTDGQAQELIPDVWAPTLVKRRGSLAAMGLVADCGRRRPSPRSGRQMIAWAATPDGLDLLARLRPPRQPTRQLDVVGEEQHVVDRDDHHDVVAEVAPLAQLDGLAPPRPPGSAARAAIARARRSLADPSAGGR